MRWGTLGVATSLLLACTREHETAAGGEGAVPMDGGPASSADAGVDCTAAPPLPVLIFTRTLGFRHDAIEKAVATLRTEGLRRSWVVEATEDPATFRAEALSRYRVVVWLLTSGDVLDDEQQRAFEAFIHGGGGFVGVHSATDTEYDWPWYGELVGAYFKVHPFPQPATLRVEVQGHPATWGLGETWRITDEWYAFRTNPRAKVHVLLSLDEASYDVDAGAAGGMGDHPVAWYRGFDGGRAFTTALGHPKELWDDPAFVGHVAGGVDWAGGRTLPGLLMEDFVGVTSPSPSPWEPQGYAADLPPFSFEVGADALTMNDDGKQNQHLTRRGVSVDPACPYVFEALFQVPTELEGGDGDDLNSFCLNLNVAGPEGDRGPVTTWAGNVDFAARSPGGTMKAMGFEKGRFITLGDHPVPWAQRGQEYLLRVAVNTAEDGEFQRGLVTTRVLKDGVLQEHFTTDYGPFPYQPGPGAVHLGVNTHGTRWRARGFRAYSSRGATQACGSSREAASLPAATCPNSP